LAPVLSVSLNRMEVRPLTEAQGRGIATWRYPDRYSTYNIGEVVTAADGYWAVVGEGEELLGYCCFGREARVPGVDEERGTLDIGYGMRPDCLGKGLGRVFVTAIIDFAIRKFSPQQLRLLILGWNQRSRKVAEALGFQMRGMVRGGEREFLVMIRPASRPS
jgi:[ribosomal protein S18]-alanine N-acetyltransferase